MNCSEAIMMAKWDQFKKRVRSQWGLMEDREIDAYRADLNELARQIVDRCQESRAVVQNFIDNLWFAIFVRGSKYSMPENSPLRIQGSED